jgi:VWFA-related protein
VRVDALVTDGGRPVRGLAPADFVVLDNGTPQTVDLASFETLPVNVILAFDQSNSVTGERLAQLRDAARAVLGALQPRDQAALVTFSHRVELRQVLTHESRLVVDAVSAAKPSGDTSLFDGVYAGLLVGVNDTARNLVLVFSDGVDTSSWLGADQIIETAKRSDAVVYALSPKGAGSVPFSPRADGPDGRLHHRGGVASRALRALRGHPRGVPPPLPSQLFTEGRPGTGLASPGCEAEESPRHGEGSPRIYRSVGA